MRKRIIGAVVLALSGVLLLALLNVNSLVRRNKDYLVGRAAQALGREISVDEIDITLWPAGARLANFALADDPAFSAGAFVRAEVLRIDLRLAPLFIGRFRPKGIILESPLITIVRDARGRYNFAGRGRREKNADDGVHGAPPKRAGLLFSAASLYVSGGTLRYRDLENGGDLTATQLDLAVNGFDWDEPFDVKLQGAVMAAKPNVEFKSRIGPIAGNRDYRDVPIDGTIRADALDLGKVNDALPQLRRALPKALRFDGIYTVEDLKFKGTLNHLSLKGAVIGTDASLRFE